MREIPPRPSLSMASLGAALAAAFVLIATSIAATAQEPHRGGTVTVAPSSGPSSLINQVDNGANSFALGTKYLEALVKIDDKAEFKPGLATSWKTSPDGLSWTFTIREGVKWHDGKPFVPSDVQWNMDHVWKTVWALTAIEAVKSVETQGEHSVVFHMSRPVSPAVMLTTLAERAFLIAPQGFVGTTLRQSPQNQMPTGTGPYKVTQYVHGQYIVLERNPDYWDKGKPFLDKIIWRIIPDPNSRSAALQAGEVDLVPMSALPRSEIAAARHNPKLEVSAKGYEGYVWYTGLVFNLQRQYTGNQKVRYAIAHAIDKQKLAELVYLGQAEPFTGPFPPGTKYYDASLKGYDYDLAEANRLLDEAGFPRGKDGMRFTLKLLAPPYLRDVFQLGGQYIKQTLKAVGIGADLEIPELYAYLRRVYKDHDFDLDLYNAAYMVDPCISTTGWYTSEAFRSGGYFRNHSGLQDHKVDAAAERGCTARDETVRAQSFKEFQHLTNTSLSILNLVKTDSYNTFNKRVHNVGVGGVNWYYTSWDNLWVE
jgi:peptide/nickel transport system substrate-binding protein